VDDPPAVTERAIVDLPPAPSGTEQLPPGDQILLLLSQLNKPNVHSIPK
jgi:hypothetical protein